MRAALWFLFLFAVAAALALFAGNNQGTVTVFWPPYRVDLSLNLVLLVLLATFVALYATLRAMAVLLELPGQARRWRAQQRERAAHVALFDALVHLIAGRYIRARKSAELALSRERSLQASGEPLGHAMQLRALSHLVAAESAQALQDWPQRDRHLNDMLTHSARRKSPLALELREGAQLRAARWAVDARDPQAALGWLQALPLGAGRRTLALRIRLKANRLAEQTLEALETARLLAKHRGFSPLAAQSIIRSLAGELIASAHDPAQLQRVWEALQEGERTMPELAIQAAQRLAALGGEHAQVRAWLLPVWDRLVATSDGLTDIQRVKLVRALEAGLGTADEPADREWLVRIEVSQQRNPRDACLQYLAGMVCLKRQLWGKAQQLLTQATVNLRDAELLRSAWLALAQLAEQRGDADAAARAWKRAAQA